MFGDDLGCLGTLVEALARFFRSLSTGTAFPETFAWVDFNLGIRNLSRNGIDCSYAVPLCEYRRRPSRHERYCWDRVVCSSGGTKERSCFQ